MWDRRNVLIAGAAGAGAIAMDSSWWAQTSILPKAMVVADTRFPESLSFAAAAAKPEHRLAMIDGDVTALWYDTLDQLWRTELLPIAGLTGNDALFCLERLAMDRGLRVVFKDEHRYLDGNRLSQAFTARVRQTGRATSALPPLLVSWVIAPRRNAAGVRA